MFRTAPGFYGPRSHCHVENELLVDLKRLNDFEFDEKHWYAVVGSGVIYSQFQEECLRRGGYVVIGGGGAQASVIANLIGDGWSPLSHRIGLPHRRILGTEMVLPDGEILKMGSLAVGDDWFWGDGIGPDLRGLLRGYTGLRGCLGIVTKMAVKVLPFQPERLEPTGIAPNTALALPEKRVKWINYIMPSKEAQVKSMYEIGKAEIGGAVTKVPLFWRAIAKAECKEEFWDMWLKETPETVANFHIVRVLLIGFTNEEQLTYDENVLNDIMMECGGQPRRDQAQRRILDQECGFGRHVADVRFLCFGGLRHRDAEAGDRARAGLCGAEEEVHASADARSRRSGLVPEL